MSKPILEIQKISKRFSINSENASYLSLRDSIMGLLGSKNKRKDDFFALEDVSFNVLEGDSIGIIGRNGAGKSTLLKILSKITPPTSGKIVCRGRMASLLEVGTGFHPELTGRENIFFNGSILGMKKAEIVKNFDEIVEFSGVEKFLDTPLKHYSSGMQLRLAFSVAAFLQNEILVIDEVLAVGDASFQKKCIDKMEDVSKNGRTIIFVSHNMGSVINLCNKAVFLDKGTLKMMGNCNEVASRYMADLDGTTDNIFNADIEKCKNKVHYIEKVITKKLNGHLNQDFGFNERICLSFDMIHRKKTEGLILSVALLDKFGNRVVTQLKEIDHSDEFKTSIMLRFPPGIFAPNHYSFHFALCTSDGSIFDIHEGKCKVRILDTGTKFSQYEGKDYGTIILEGDWVTNT